jgi:hypothetical protein
MSATHDPFENLHLQVLEEIDPEYGTLVARCLETGTTVTADDAATLRKLITEALQLHIKLAAERGDAEAIYHQRATPDVWVRYNAAASAGPSERVTLEVDVSGTPRRGVKSEISIVRSLQRETA